MIYLFISMVLISICCLMIFLNPKDFFPNLSFREIVEYVLAKILFRIFLIFAWFDKIKIGRKND